MRFREYELDPFQEQAFECIQKNNSVVVSAPTGTGKTLIADFVIDRFKNSSKRIIYTSPIKALSNQKFRQFSEIYGEEKVGLMTGDFVINPDAQLIIMTTEIYRNMLVTKDEFVESISYVIFDEIHYINDIERGTVWEEALIFSPDHIRFLCLSATIPNARDFADWIESIKSHKVDVVSNNRRAVPLKHYLYDKTAGICTLDQLRSFYSHSLSRSRRKGFSKRNRKKQMQIPSASHLDLVDSLDEEGFLPAIYFSFSRKECEKKAQELARKKDFLSPEQKSKAMSILSSKISSLNIGSLLSVSLLRQTLNKGIAFHHAGILPTLKEVVEELFSEGLVKVLYATETFAVGVNMPAKSVSFDSLEKYDGISFRYLTSKEYWQMAGRAGRRGIDKVGWAVALVNMEFIDFNKIDYITSGDKEPLVSRFQLTDNLILNLIKNYDEDTIKEVLKKSFYYYLKRKSEGDIRIWARFINRRKKLKAYGYISQDGKTLTQKGEFASKIYDHELEFTELFTSGVAEKLSEPEINAVVAAILFDRKTERERFKLSKDKSGYHRILNQINSRSAMLSKNINRKNLLRLMRLVMEWSEDAEFSDIVQLTSMREGDIIRLFRQIIDFLGQAANASSDWSMIRKIESCISMLKRGIVEVL